MSDERQALKRLLAYALNELERIDIDIDHHRINGNGKVLVEWCNATDRYEVADD